LEELSGNIDSLLKDSNEYEASKQKIAANLSNADWGWFVSADF
jgi:hypothetical protein